MFDTVGRSRKQNPVQQGLSALLSLFVTAGGMGGLWWAGQQFADEILEVEELLEVTFYDAAPPPPPPPPPPAGGSTTPKTETKKEKKPDPVEVEPDPEPEELPEEIPEEVPEEEPEEAAADAGVVGGVEGGVEGGVVGGVIGGVVGGVIGGQLGGTGLTAVHHSQAKVKRRVDPKMPQAAQDLGLKTSRCVATISVDEKGKPFDVKVADCPNIFHQEIRKAALATRFYPHKVNGKPVKMSTKFVYTFKITN